MKKFYSILLFVLCFLTAKSDFIVPTAISAYYVDYDYAGNIYAYNGQRWEVKYNSSGVQQWNVEITDGSSTPYSYAHFCTDRSSGSSYISSGIANGIGGSIYKYYTNGVFAGKTTDDPQMAEPWRLSYNCNGVISIGSGGINMGQKQYSVIDTNMFITGVNQMAKGYHDVMLLTSDNDYAYYLTAQGAGEAKYDNTLVKCPIVPTAKWTWIVQTGYTYREYTIPYYAPTLNYTSNYNGMVNTADYIFISNGETLSKYKKTDGSLVSSIVFGLPSYLFSGIAVDCNCNGVINNHVYVVFGNKVLEYDQNLNYIQTFFTYDTAYCIQIYNSKLIVSGKNFIQTITIPTVCDATPLPIVLIDFSVTHYNGEILIQFKAQEYKNSYFTIHRSYLDYPFSPFIKIYTKDPYGINSYACVDTDTTSGLRYYQLEQTDIDGTTKVLDTKAITVRCMEMNSDFNDLIGREVPVNYPLPKIKHEN